MQADVTTVFILKKALYKNGESYVSLVRNALTYAGVDVSTTAILPNIFAKSLERSGKYAGKRKNCK